MIYWVGVNAIHDYRRNRAMARVEALGGTADVTEEGTFLARIVSPDKSTIVQLAPYAMQSLELGDRESMNALGDEELEAIPRLTDTMVVRLINTNVTDRGLSHVLDMPRLTVLSVVGGRVTDGGLHQFAEKGTVEFLSLEELVITDEGLRQLRAAPLRDLTIVGSTITDDGLRHLQAMRLVSLCIRGGHVRGPGLKHLSQITTLAAIDLSSQEIRGSGLEHLVGLTKRVAFTEIRLDHNPIADDGLMYLQGWHGVWRLSLAGTHVKGPGLRHLPNAAYLYLQDTPLDDEGLTHLPTMEDLHELDVRGTRVTSDGVTTLSKRMPSVRVRWGSERQRGAVAKASE